MRWSVIVLLFFSHVGDGEDSLIGRPQAFAYTEGAVRARAATKYQGRIDELRNRGTLDDDRNAYLRVKRIAAGLIEQAIVRKPDSRTWQWEVHTTSDANEEASSLAGGKLLFGTTYVKALNLNDGELATMMGHEIAHAIAEHQREVVSQVLILNQASIPLSVDTAMARLEDNLSLQIQLSGLLKIQEAEADQLGMAIAHDAGWPTASILSFYRKLAASETPTILSFAYPSPTSRLEMAQVFCAKIAKSSR